MFIEGVKNSDFLTILDKKSFNNLEKRDSQNTDNSSTVLQ